MELGLVENTKLHFYEMPCLFLGNTPGILATNLILYFKVSSPLSSLPKCQQEAETAEAPRPPGCLLRGTAKCRGVSFDAASAGLSANLVFKV